MAYLQELLDKQLNALDEVSSVTHTAEFDKYVTDDVKEFLDQAEELGIFVHGPSAAVALTILAQEIGNSIYDDGQISQGGLYCLIDTLNALATALNNLPRRNE
jgi:hypothetical protein